MEPMRRRKILVIFVKRNENQTRLPEGCVIYW